MGLFDSPTHLIILLVVVLVLFGSSRLPGAAQAIGKSMNIFKRSIRHDDDDDQEPGGNPNYTQATVLPPAQQQPAPPAPQLSAQQPSPAHQAQIDELQRQVADLQKSAAANGSSSVQDSTPSSSSN
ncbi:MAG TPA: twin-arginine translocase TatA/TatE family subunit [Streptosporangiaceae bacterium]|nr:twin-arginine translocase TatA/TatE family subunit [Streptosporangiaceae bacterium]